jgi:hypothetical protein
MGLKPGGEGTRVLDRLRHQPAEVGGHRPGRNDEQEPGERADRDSKAWAAGPSFFLGKDRMGAAGRDPVHAATRLCGPPPVQPGNFHFRRFRFGQNVLVAT